MKHNFIKTFVRAIIALFIFTPTINAQNWSPLGAGVSGDSSVIFTTGTFNNSLYIAGIFSSAGNTAAGSIAQWNGNAWAGLGTGFAMDANFYAVQALASYNGGLYAAGQFDSVNGIGVGCAAVWNGTSWADISQSVVNADNGSYLDAMIVYNGNLFVAGSFDDYTNVNQWNGSSWIPTDPNFADNYVFCFAVYKGNLYAGGYLYGNDGNVYGLAEWDGTNWNMLGQIGAIDPLAYDEVTALTVYNGNLIVGGNFDSLGGLPFTNLAQWDGTNWSAVGGGILPTDSGDVYALATVGDTLYVGGSFNYAGATPAYGLAAWNGTSWSTPGNLSQFGIIESLLPEGDSLYAAGYFNTINGTAANDIALLTASNCVVTTTNVPVTIACGDSVSFGGSYYSLQGNYPDTLTSTGGCDSIIVLQLTVTGGDTTYTYDTICANSSVYFNGVYENIAGSYTALYTSSGGCDSLVILQLTVNALNYTNSSATVACGDSFNFYGSYYHLGGTYYDTLTSSIGCDSIIALQLTATGGDSTYINDTLCNTDTLVYNGESYTTSGNYVVHLNSVANCDSVIFLALDFEICGSISGISQNNLFSLYPNPAGDYTLLATSPEAIGSVMKLFDLTGKQLMTMKITDTTMQLQLSALPAGAYIISVETAGTQAVKMLVKTE
jgi:hypothetical protein